MPAANLALLDTSVYIENVRTGRFTLVLLRSPWIVRCSAVVVHELRRGARTPLELRFVKELARKVRILTPTERHWLESAEILSRIGARKGYDASKLRDLAFDTLIALSARDSGATLVTCNREDFAEIGKHLAFKVIFWQRSRSNIMGDSNVCRGKLWQAQVAGEPGDGVAIVEVAAAAARRDQARLIKQVYEGDLLVCPQCRGAMRIMAFIEQPEVVEKILTRLGLWPARAHSPPASIVA